jgi:hypothetical protein
MGKSHRPLFVFRVLYRGRLFIYIFNDPRVSDCLNRVEFSIAKTNEIRKVPHTKFFGDFITDRCNTAIELTECALAWKIFT